MTEQQADPGGTPAPGPDDLTATPTTPGDPDAGAHKAVPGAYEADEQEQSSGREWKPGN